MKSSVHGLGKPSTPAQQGTAAFQAAPDAAWKAAVRGRRCGPVGAPYLDASRIENNTVYGNAAQVASGGGGMADCYPTVLRNNILWANTDTATGGSQSAAELLDDQFIDCEAETAGGSEPPSYSCIQDWPGGGTGNIATDPEFLSTNPQDPWHEFLHLDGESPCVDTAEVDASPIKDFDDQAGPIKMSGIKDDPAIPDIGADEYPTQPASDFPFWWKVFE